MYFINGRNRKVWYVNVERTPSFTVITLCNPTMNQDWPQPTDDKMQLFSDLQNFSQAHLIWPTVSWMNELMAESFSLLLPSQMVTIWNLQSKNICNICPQRSDHARLKVSHSELPRLQVVNEIGCSKTNVKEVGCSGWSQVKKHLLKDWFKF